MSLRIVDFNDEGNDGWVTVTANPNEERVAQASKYFTERDGLRKFRFANKEDAENFLIVVFPR